MAGRQGAGLDVFAHGGRKLQQAHGVGDVAAGFGDERAELVLRDAELDLEALVAFGFLDGVEVLALEVLDQGGGHGLRVGKGSQQHRDFVQPGGLRGAPAAFAGDDLVIAGRFGVGAGEDGLEHALLLDGGGEVGQGGGVDEGAGLEGAGFEDGDGEHGAGAAGGRGVTQEGGEAAAEAGVGAAHGLAAPRSRFRNSAARRM